jgi:uncharacterized membrane protein HdeD (DUF308 family)
MFDVGRIGWIFILRGVFALLFALALFANPGLSLMTLVFAFGLYAISDGVYALGAAFRHADEGEKAWWALFVEGFASVFAGGIALFLFQTNSVAFVSLIAAWAVVNGGMEICGALYLRKHIAEEILLGGSGVVSMLFGVTIAFFAGYGAQAMTPWIVAFAVIYGATLIDLGVRLRRWMAPGLNEFQHRFSPGVEHYIH